MSTLVDFEEHSQVLELAKFIDEQKSVGKDQASTACLTRTQGLLDQGSKVAALISLLLSESAILLDGSVKGTLKV
jgi:hypothetical protein